jgi:hypothetical protein
MADTVTKAAHELTEAIQSNMQKQVNDVDMQELGRLAKIFEEAAKKVAEQDARTSRVPTTRASPPRVPTALNEELNQGDETVPRVGSPEAPRYFTRQRKRMYGTPLTDAMLTVMELSGITASPRRLAQRKYSSQV